MSRKRDVHVVPREDGWAVRREGASRDSSHHDRKSDAVESGRGTARRDGVEVVSTARTAASRTAIRTATIRIRPSTGNTNKGERTCCRTVNTAHTEEPKS